MSAKQKKQILAKAEKSAEDKTFGLKNKNKSKKVQAYVQAVKKQVEAKVEARLGIKPVSASAAEAAKAAAKAAAAHEKELAALLRASVKQPKLDPGVDPKSVLCEFFKAGICEKGDKCKFSHDLTIGRKAARVDIYQDKRDEDKIDDWDQAKLESVVKTKHGGEKMQTKTDIVCIYFLDALEKELYGWFWECPNGGAACKYRHCLPPGYVFKTKKEREAEAAAKAALGDKDSNLEELIELERAKLPTTGLTPVTAETFAKFREDKMKRKAAELETKRLEEAKKVGSGKGFSALSGRALFTYDPSLFIDDEAADDDVYSEGGGEGGEEGSVGGGEEAGVVDTGVFLEGDAELDELGEEEEEEEGEGEEEEGGEEEEEGGEEGGEGAPRGGAGGE